MHVTLKVAESLPDLREELGELVAQCLRESKTRQGFRLVHYSILTHHLHLIVEANNAECLSRGVQALCIRMAKRINRALRRRGRVFVDRYFGRILRTPRQTRACLCYVLNNVRRHAAQHGRKLMAGWMDDGSSAPYFDGWREAPARPPPDEDPPVVPPGTWLLRTGWRRQGLLSIDDVPGAR